MGIDSNRSDDRRRAPLDGTGLMGAVFAISLLLGVLTPPAHAQDAAKLQLRVSQKLIAEGANETPLAISIEPADAVPPRSFLRIRGLPPTVALSDGHTLAPGYWAVPLRAVPGLRLIVPEGVAQSRPLSLSLVTVDGAVLSEATTQLIITPAARVTDQISEKPAASETPARAASAVAATLQEKPNVPAPTPATPPIASPAAQLTTDAKLSPEERRRLTRIVEKGDEQLAEGSVAAARLLYARAADGGLAQAALALGGTFDPHELSRLKVIGLSPDVEQARSWYQKAQALGSPQAADRLKRLTSR